MKQIYKIIEPFVIHIRAGCNSDVKAAMVDSLNKEHGFVHIDVEKNVRGEAERGTPIGLELNNLISSN